MTDFLQDHPDGVILALDEMSLYYQATHTQVWAPVGQTPLVKVHPGRDHCHFYGAVNLRTGREIASPVMEMTSRLTVKFLQLLLDTYSQPIFLLMDRAPWHRGEVTPFLEQTPRLQALFFPPACPDLNPQEHVWDQAREALSHNHTFRSFHTLISAFETYLHDTRFACHFMDTYTPLGLGVF